ncbi:MAG: cysteine hydrolase, partial [Gammaproteobacteria bacterium]
MRVSLNAEPEAIDIDLERSAVCVIDMQNFDVKPGGAFDLTGVDITHGQRVIAPIQRVLTLARSIGMPVIFTRTGIPRDRLLWPTEDSPW